MYSKLLTAEPNGSLFSELPTSYRLALFWGKIPLSLQEKSPIKNDPPLSPFKFIFYIFKTKI